MTTLPLANIKLRSDARAIDPASVHALADSICEVGLINPIRVRQTDAGWEVIAGAHRLQACASLGLVEIDCIVVDDDDLTAELAMIDENLCRAELSPSDRARQTARRKAIYEELHPETRHGGEREPSRQVGDLPRFTEDTAKATGQSERTVQRVAERGEKILPEVLDMIRGTKLDTGAYLDKLKALPGSEQYKAASRDLLNLRSQERQAVARAQVKQADIPLDDEAAQEKQFAALVSAWNKAGPEVRQRFREEVVDTALFDRSAA